MANSNDAFAPPTDEDYGQSVFEDGGSLIVDLSGVSELKFELIPKGIYDAVVEELNYGPSKSSGSPMFTWILAIEGGDYAGRKLYYYTSFSQKAIRGTKTSLMRIDPETFGGQFNPAEVAESGKMLGKNIRIRVGHQERSDNGEMQATVQGVMPANTGASGEGASNGGGFFNN